MSNKTRACVIISGRVQGVFFRLETKKIAERFGVLGWVKNKPYGMVEAVFEGDEENVKSVLNWCNQGPPIAKVKNVDVTWEDCTDEFSEFEIIYIDR